MRFTEIGQQLRAYRLESGLRAEEIAAQLGVSRAALYRYEKGDVIKLDTIQRLAELLKISPLSLLGIGVEYYNRPVAFFERLRQMEETADQILMIDGPACYLTTSPQYDTTLAEVLGECDLATDPTAGLLLARKHAYAQRRPGIIFMLPQARLETFLRDGVAPGLPVSERTRRLCRQTAAAEVEAMAALMEAEPMGLQFGILPGHAIIGAFVLLRSRDRAWLAINPFRPDGHPGAANGVAIVTAADEAVAAHQRVAEAQWRAALKGAAGAARLRELAAAAGRYGNGAGDAPA
jgi:transcriptional regulator with XRE-family HTH domain